MEPVALGRVTTLSPGRVAAWFALAIAMAALAYGSNAAADTEPGDDVLFQWSTAASAAVLYAIIFAVLLAIARPVDPTVLGFRRPDSWGKAIGLILAGFVAIAVAAAVLDAAGLNAGDEQGLVPKDWDPSRAAPFVANFVVVALVAPLVEEAMFRGVGFAAVRQHWGALAATAVTAVLFGLAHGLLVALPVLAAFGVVLAVVRQRTDSIYPPIALHALFNALALIAGVTGVGS
ncbi:MAG: CPBP family intramembrane metalloprotease [Actinobacteria bacterium]|nr:CPBP family intramembrane metalloprotease [Actinomycetota bacterium]